MFYFDGELIDFTPFKILNNVYPAVYTIDENATPPTYGSYNFTFCMLISSTTVASDYTCDGDYYAVGSPVDNFACKPYSGSETSDLTATQVFDEEVTY